MSSIFWKLRRALAVLTSPMFWRQQRELICGENGPGWKSTGLIRVAPAAPKRTCRHYPFAGASGIPRHFRLRRPRDCLSRKEETPRRVDRPRAETRPSDRVIERLRAAFRG